MLILSLANRQLFKQLIYAIQGKKEEALNEWNDFPVIVASYDYDNEFVPLHGYPAYEEFVKPKG
ncbi:MAG: hypothetical protein O7F74_01020 [Bacteroidetes bacterium]|nr:hypothetical protein [Bacteroidota bacterium]